VTHPLEQIHPRSLKLLSDRLQHLVAERLWLKVLIGMGLGIGLGIALGPTVGLVPRSTASLVGSWLALPGQIFLAAIQMVVVPLVFASVIRGIAASESLEQLRHTGLRTVLFFAATTTIAIGIGIGFALLIAPGRFLDAALVRDALATAPATTGVEDAPAQSVPDAIVSVIPTNPLGSMVESEMLGVVIFAAVVGVALISMAPRESSPLLTLLGSLQQVAMTIVKWVMRMAPLAVLGLMAQLTSMLGFDALLGLSVYVGTVLLGLIVLLVGYLGLVASLGRMSPLRFLAAVRGVQLLAFSTSSSAAVMPMSIEVAEDRLDVRPSVSQFVIPLGATINMNGTALYQGVATVFLAQVFGLELSAGQLGLVVLTAVAASIGSPATPGVGIVILSMVLGAAGVPLAGLGLVVGVDRILDMSRTAVNVTGDLVAARVLDRGVRTGRPTEEQRRAELERERQRQQSGLDVIVDADAQPTA
jgi:Na+/H+-dicarboxylate symporter